MPVPINQTLPGLLPTAEATKWLHSVEVVIILNRWLHVKSLLGMVPGVQDPKDLK